MTERQAALLRILMLDTSAQEPRKWRGERGAWRWRQVYVGVGSRDWYVTHSNDLSGQDKALMPWSDGEIQGLVKIGALKSAYLNTNAANECFINSRKEPERVK